MCSVESLAQGIQQDGFESVKDDHQDDSVRRRMA